MQIAIMNRRQQRFTALFAQLLMIMRLTSALLLAFSLQVAARGSGQTVTLSLRNAPLNKIFKEIKQQTGVSFLWDEKWLKETRKITIKVSNAPIGQVLDSCLKDGPLTYYMVDKIIVIKFRDQARVVEPPLPAPQPPILLKGKVFTEKGAPLEGATVQVKGAARTTATRADGSFSLEAEKGDATLVISFVGMETQEVSINGRTDFVIQLKSSDANLSDIVIIGYGSVKKVNLTGAVSTVKGSDLQDQPASNLSSTLAGRMPGVIVNTTSGKPGISSSIQIRSAGTLNNTDPLYVIDGVVNDKFAFDGIDANEVESISVLKDAASAAVYGSRAANGVILVTTRKGKAGKSVLSYAVTYGAYDPVKIPQTMNAFQEATFDNDALRLSNADTSNSGYFTPDELTYFKTHNYSFIDEAWRNPTVNHHTLSASGGSEKIRYYLGGSYYYETGTFDNISFHKYNLRASIDADIAKGLKLSANLNTDSRNDDEPFWLYSNGDDQLTDLYKGMLVKTHTSPGKVNGLINGTYIDWNPLAIIDKSTGYNKKKWANYNGILSLEYQVPFIKGLSAKFSYANYARHQFTKWFSLPYQLYVFNTLGGHNHIVGDQVQSVKTRNDGQFLTELYDNYQNYQLDAYLTYDRKFGKHAVNALFVYEQAENTDDNFNARRDNFISSTVDQLFAGNSINSTANGSGSQSGRLSYVGRVNYNYDGRYILEASMRYDGSVIFAPSKRWGFFPSVSAGWRLSQEKFFRDNIKFIDDFKLRGSIGLLGNDAIGGWQWTQRYNITDGAVFGDITKGVLPGVIPNPNVTWEKSKTYNGGFDAAFLNNKLSLSFDAFYRHTYDILGARTLSVPTTFGALMPAENYAVINSHGIEIDLGYQDNIGKDFTYFIRGNLAYAGNKIVRIDQATNIRPYQNRIGRNLDAIMGYREKGIIRSQKELGDLSPTYTIFGAKPLLGAMDYYDLRGATSDAPDGKVDDQDQVFIASHTIPPINYGISLGGKWKSVSLNLLFQGTSGNQKLIDWQRQLYNTVESNFSFWNDHWTPENPDAVYPRAGNGANNEHPSTFWLRNDAFLRLKNVDLSYDLPVKLLRRVGLARTRLFFIGTNLLLLQDHVKIMDPEQATIRSYPVMKSYSVGANISL